MADNKLVITISGDSAELEKTLADVSKKIFKTGEDAGNAGTAGGKSFVKGLSGELGQIKSLATGSFTGLADAFINLAVNPITLAVGTLGATLYAAFSLAKVGEENQKIAKNFEFLVGQAGLNASQLTEQIKQATDGYVGLSEILPIAGDAVLKLGKNSQELGSLFELSRNIASRTGRDITDVFQSITNGIARQNEKLLQANGITLDTNTVLGKYASANEIAKDRLSDTAKQQAFLNEVLTQGKQKFGDNAKETFPLEGGLKKLTLATGDLKDAVAQLANSKLGEFFAGAISATAGAVKAFSKSVGLLNGDLGTTDEQIQRLEQHQNSLRVAMESNKYNPDVLKVYQDNIDKTSAKIEALRAKQEEIAKSKPAETSVEITKEEKTLAESPEEVTARLQRISDLKAEYQRMDAETEAQIALQKYEATDALEASYDEKQQFRLENKRASLEAEYQATLDKNNKIKDSTERAYANELALAKKDNEEKKFIAQQDVARKKTSAEAKLAIEQNLFEASLNFAQGNAQATKAIQIAQAIRNTYVGATKALEVYPPPFNAIAAASTVALGLSQVAKITGANQGALVTGGETGKDTNPFLLSKGEIVAPAKSYDNVVEGEIRARGFVKGDENQATNALLEQILGKLQTPSIVVNSDFLTDENSINKLADKLREAVQFRGAELA